MKKIKLILLLGLFFIPIIVSAQSISDYLILQDIGLYKLDKPEKYLPGEPATGGPRLYKKNVLSGAGHFPDHADITYGTMYIGGGTITSPEVKVTQHVGGDSDRLLLHESERSFRRGSYAEDMTPARFRNIDGNNVFYSGLGGGHYRWLNNYIVIDISYTDLYKQKQEPIEVVKAYLAKFPSTVSGITIDSAHNVQWIKDEMDRRLWLCDKWNLQFQADKTTQKDLFNNLISNMEVFLNYRQKYFSDINALNELIALNELQKNNDITSIQTKLTTYKTWWNANKGKRISL